MSTKAKFTMGSKDPELVGGAVSGHAHGLLATFKEICDRRRLPMESANRTPLFLFINVMRSRTEHFDEVVFERRCAES